MTRFSNYIRR